MDNSKFLKTVIIILLLINIGTLAFMWMQHQHGMPPPHQPAIGNYLMHELKFTEAQKNQFEQMRDEHRREIDGLRKKSRERHDSFFDLLGNSQADSNSVNQMADSITSLQKEIEISTFYHFQKVRTICTREQQEKFDEIIKEALRMMAPRKHGR